MNPIFDALDEASDAVMYLWRKEKVSELSSAVKELFETEPGWVSVDFDLALRAIHLFSVKGGDEGLLNRIKTAVQKAGVISSSKASQIIDQCFDKDNFVPLWGLLDSGFDINSCLEVGQGILERIIMNGNYSFVNYSLANKLLEKGVRFQEADDEGVLMHVRKFFLYNASTLPKEKALAFVDLALQRGLNVNVPDRFGFLLLDEAFKKCEDSPGIWTKLLNAMSEDYFQLLGNLAGELLHTFCLKAKDSNENLVFLEQLLKKMPKDIEVWEDGEGNLPCLQGRVDRITVGVERWLVNYYADNKRKLGMLLSLGRYDDETKQLIEQFKREGSWGELFFDLIKKPGRDLGILQALNEDPQTYMDDLCGIVSAYPDEFQELQDEIKWLFVHFMTPDELSLLVKGEKMHPLSLGGGAHEDLLKIIKLDSTYDSLEKKEDILLHGDDFRELALQAVAQGVVNGRSNLLKTAFDVLTEEQQRVVLAGLEEKEAVDVLSEQWVSRGAFEFVKQVAESVKVSFLQKLLESDLGIDLVALKHEILPRVERRQALRLRKDRPYAGKVEALYEEFGIRYQRVETVGRQLIMLKRSLREQLQKGFDNKELNGLLQRALNKIDLSLELRDRWVEVKRQVDGVKKEAPIFKEPSVLTCPISYEPIKTAVCIQPDVEKQGDKAWKYEHGSLHQWFEESKRSEKDELVAQSPQTRVFFRKGDIVPAGRKKRKVVDETAI